MISAVMPFGVMAFLFNEGDMQLSTYEINPLFWVILAVAIAGIAYRFVRRKKK